MLLTMERQLLLFIFSLISGVLIGVLFDVYRIIRGFENIGKIVTVVEDILFWIATGCIVFLFMMYTNYAYMNFNVFVYILTGLLIYIKVISSTFIDILNKLLHSFTKIIRVIFYLVSYPVRFCIYKINGKIKN
ncbi:spore cortex biosynthesis protein YabQ [Clostridium ihumii]|uniref:spore cortex biosynthesis protein YabQ n=1 Tax=Clostridium ihumii TaxID=1470356 RepID=UPI003D327604